MKKKKKKKKKKEIFEAINKGAKVLQSNHISC